MEHLNILSIKHTANIAENILFKNAMAQKRKISDEKRQFKDSWELRFLVKEQSGRVLCLICNEMISVMKEYNVQRHYSTLHVTGYDKYTGEARRALLNDLKSNLRKRQEKMFQLVKPSSSTTIASCDVSLLMAKSKKAFSDGDLIKRCAIAMGKAMGFNDAARGFEKIPLSHQTVARRVEELSNFVQEKVMNQIQQCVYFSLALDESTDIRDVSQLLVFVRSIDSQFNVSEELLGLLPLFTTTKGSDIYEALNSLVSKYGGFQKCSCIVTDGAKSMTGAKRGVIAYLRDAGVDCPMFHCIIHQESLSSRCIRLSDVMQHVMKIINFIRGGNKALRHRLFVDFLKDLDTEFSDVSLHSTVRWLSAGKCLQQFFSLRNEILNFLEELNAETDGFKDLLQDVNFLKGLAFLTDITQHLNKLNLSLQGRNQTIASLYGFIDGFRKKLCLFKSNLQSNILIHFPSCDVISKEIEDNNFCCFVETLDTLIEDFNKRFQDFRHLEKNFNVFNAPLTITISEADEDLQLELCDLQSDQFLLSKATLPITQFWPLLSEEHYPNLRRFGLHLLSMFGSTYLCEAAFSAMKSIKSKERNLLKQTSLEACLRLALTSVDIDTKELASKIQAHPSH